MLSGSSKSANLSVCTRKVFKEYIEWGQIVKFWFHFAFLRPVASLLGLRSPASSLAFQHPTIKLILPSS